MTCLAHSPSGSKLLQGHRHVQNGLQPLLQNKVQCRQAFRRKGQECDDIAIR